MYGTKKKGKGAEKMTRGLYANIHAKHKRIKLVRAKKCVKQG